MQTIFYKASDRGHANHGWLNTYHTFSFSNYYNPARINFGALRVVNDDTIAGGMGFGKHPHDNMEIITIPLHGDLEHEDSMGNKGIIRHGDVQVMSAGSGILHSEFNANKDQEVQLFQIWVFPNKENVKPRYQQESLFFTDERAKNKLQQIVSPDSNDEGLWIHQDAWFNIGFFEKGFEFDYPLKAAGNGLFAMVIEGSFEVGGKQLDRRDALGLWDTPSAKIKALSDDARILLIEVPMTLGE